MHFQLLKSVYSAAVFNIGSATDQWRHPANAIEQEQLENRPCNSYDCPFRQRQGCGLVAGLGNATE
jgi:hypothetical protein